MIIIVEILNHVIVENRMLFETTTVPLGCTRTTRRRQGVGSTGEMPAQAEFWTKGQRTCRI